MSFLSYFIRTDLKILFIADASCCLQYQQAVQLQQVPHKMFLHNCCNHAFTVSATTACCVSGTGVRHSRCRRMLHMIAGIFWTDFCSCLYRFSTWFSIFVFHNLPSATLYAPGASDSPSIHFMTNSLCSPRCRHQHQSIIIISFAHLPIALANREFLQMFV